MIQFLFIDFTVFLGPKVTRNTRTDHWFVLGCIRNMVEHP